MNYPTALEAALKLRELSYIPSEGTAAGEMKHGTNALIDEHLPVVAIALRDPTYISDRRGNDVDQPRNLAKSVTVE